MTNLIRSNFSEDSVTSKQPVAVVVSDGGPDHRVTFGSVQVSALAIIHALDLDMAVFVRTCPYQSWQNVAERVMSTLNLALQNVSLARTKMSDRFEKLVKNKNTMAVVREAINAVPELHYALQDSMASPMITLGQRFQAMQVKDVPIKLGIPASDSELANQFQHVAFIDPSLTSTDLKATTLKKADAYQGFFKAHCHSSQYMFQVKKCKDPNCYYCMRHPIRLPHEVFESLHFLPLPLLDSSKQHYKKFKELYGSDPSDVDRPSRVPTPSDEAKGVDKAMKGLLVCGKVRGVIICIECSKPRCIYSHSKLTHEQIQVISKLKDADLYTCGASLFPPDSLYHSTIIVREALVCTSNMETQYYSSVLVHFEPVCFYCGICEETLVDNDQIKELKTMYAVVYPICFLCLSEGKSPHCKHPSNVAKKRKTH